MDINALIEGSVYDSWTNHFGTDLAITTNNGPRRVIQFYNDDTLVYATKAWDGDTVAYVGNTPTRPNDDILAEDGTTVIGRTVYTFAGWDKDLGGIQGDMTIYAQYTSINYYDVMFINYNNEVLYRYYVEQGQSAVYVGNTPAKPNSDILDEESVIGYNVYTFTGWDIPLNNVQTMMVYKAQYSYVNYYLINFRNYEGTLLQSMFVLQGTDAIFTDDTPIKPNDDIYGNDGETIIGYVKYTFSTWDKSVLNVQGHMEFTAQYTSANYYVVNFYNYNMALLESIFVKQGLSATYPGSTEPTQPITEVYAGDDTTILTYIGYTFSGWDKPLNNIQDFTEVVAQYTPDYTYAVFFRNYDDSILKTIYVPAGNTASYTGDVPAKPNDNIYNGQTVIGYNEYTFDKWDKTFTAIQGVTNYYAQYKVTKYYVVNFYNYNNALLQSIFVKENNNATYTGSTPTKPTDNTYAQDGQTINSYIVYTFSTWNATLTNVQTGINAYAQFSSVTYYGVRFFNYNEALLYETFVQSGSTVTYSGSIPTRPNSTLYMGDGTTEQGYRVYTFSTWDETLTNVQSYLAVHPQYSTVDYYVVIFANYDNTVLLNTYIRSGLTAAYSGDTPTKKL